MAEKKHPDKHHGKKPKQRMKPYIVLQYLLKNTDAEHFATGKDIEGFLQESCLIYAERRSIYKDIEEINEVNWMLENDSDIKEAEKVIANDKYDTEKLIRISKLFDCSLDYLLKDEIEQMDINVVEANEEARFIKLRAGVLTYLSFPPIFGWIVGIYSLKFQKENMKSKTQIGLTIVGILFSLTLTVIMIAGVAFGL